MKTHERVARNVKAYAGFLGLSMETVYAGASMSKQVFNNRMTGKSRWRADELETLALFLETTVNTLLSDPSDLLARLRVWVTAVEAQAA